MSMITAAIVGIPLVVAGGAALPVEGHIGVATHSPLTEVHSVAVPDTVSKKSGLPIATSPTYGYTEKEPILVGGVVHEGPARSRKFVSSLRGPNGEAIKYRRLGSCCPFETSNSELGSGLLDKYELTYEGLAEPLVIYVNMYDPGVVMIPQGLTMAE